MRRGERLLASVVQTVDDGIFTAEVGGRLVTMNPAGRRLLGVRAEQVARLGYRDLLGGDDPARVAEAIERAVAAGTGWTGQIAAAAADGAAFPAHLAVRCVFDGGGHLVGTVGVLRDLTEQVETQRRLIQREQLASLGEMAAGVAHEIRNPLGGIKMATRLLSSRDAHSPALSQEMARSILSGVLEIEGIINSLLDYTRELRLDRAEYELARVLDPVIEAAAEEARGRGVTVAYGTVDRGAMALADGQKLRQVFANVIKNAVEAIDGGGRVEVDLAVREGRVVVEVSDTGVGIAPEHRDRIFVPFFTTKPSGTGLGMSIVKRIVDLHGGDVTLESAPGAGTRVRVSLPSAPPAITQEVSS